jgi:hypothetical protein
MVLMSLMTLICDTTAEARVPEISPNNNNNPTDLFEEVSARVRGRRQPYQYSGPYKKPPQGRGAALYFPEYNKYTQ